MKHQNTPNFLPVLSRGRHRSPRKGACFMEMASFLAGERWSDHPRCTHPLLAALARMVNDVVSDDARATMAPLIPEVVGLTSDDLRVDARIALGAATSALPIASQSRQNVLAVGVLTSERVLAMVDGRPEHDVSDASRRVLGQVPAASAWAYEFAGDSAVSLRSFRRSAAPTIVATSVRGIAEATIDDADGRLLGLLHEAIATMHTLGIRGRTDEPMPDLRILHPAE